MNLELIINVVIALFIYNIILKAIGNVFIQRILESKKGQEIESKVYKTFEERIKEKQEQR
jgi:hypothetical protein